MNNKEKEDLKKIGLELWEIWNSVKISDIEKLKKKIQEFNAYLESCKNEE